MESIVNNEVLFLWLTQYGSIALFVLLVLGILALPVPEETMMVIAGILIRKGGLDVYATLIAAYAGSICGITMSYFIGRTAGHYLVSRYAKKTWIRNHFNRAHAWFERFGKWALLVGYFIPGVRHFTGFCSGMMDMKYKKFALFAYSGAIVWVTLFISLGYFFGSLCFDALEKLDLDLSILLAIVIGVVLLYLLITKVISALFK